MKEQAGRVAVCGMAAALGVVVMLLGAVLEVGLYVCPVAVSLGLIPIGRRFGLRYQVMLWLVISFLCLLLVPNPEESLLFAGFFGWYPMVQPRLERLPKVLRAVGKLAVFNGAIIALEALVLLVLAPEAIVGSAVLVLLLLGNVVFVLYDRVVCRFDRIAAELRRRLGRK